jgi:hypothetical protein
MKEEMKEEIMKEIRHNTFDNAGKEEDKERYHKVVGDVDCLFQGCKYTTTTFLI